MTPESLEQIEIIYSDALALPPQERPAFLDRACGNDRDLRAEIESLLGCEQQAGTCLDKPAIHFVAESLAAEGGGVFMGRMLGRYQLLSLVGRGGMGEVYCAVDTHLNRLVAVKILPAYLAEDPARLQRFTVEARVIAALNHPRICVLHDVGHDEGTRYLVFEYLIGQMLSDRLSGGTLPVPEALKYAIEVAEALEYAHEQGVVHHDLKPQNIMLTRTGVKLLDFGIAELRYPDADASAPESQLRSGTLPYMAPEQIEGRQTDARTDIFAFGVMTCEMITGRPVFPGTGAQAETVMPPALDVVIRGCLARDPSERWQSMSDVLLILKHVAAGI